MPWAKNILETSLKPIAEQGYVIVACNSATVDYVECARSLAQTLKTHNPAAEVCLVTDSECTDSVFDHVRYITNANPANPYENDWQAFYQTPFRETIKLEADMWIVSNIDHWWDMFRHRDLVISTGCRTWRDEISSNRRYRRGDVQTLFRPVRRGRNLYAIRRAIVSKDIGIVTVVWSNTHYSIAFLAVEIFFTSKMWDSITLICA